MLYNTFNKDIHKYKTLINIKKERRISMLKEEVKKK